MVDKKRFFEILEERKKAHVNDPDIDVKYWYSMVETLGDDETDIINFINSLDSETASWISEIYEEVVEKFPSDEMEETFHKINPHV